jgi:hypothetical protein
MAPAGKLKKARVLLFSGAACLLLWGMVFAGADNAAKGTSGKENATAAAPANQKAVPSSVKQIIFEEQKIEGKIRRPQLVLIKADQRPDFGAMVMEATGKSKNTAAVDRGLIEDALYKGAFRFEGTKVVDLAP